jgi:recombination protein RecR
MLEREKDIVTMNYYPASIRNLIRQIAKLPGIGEKTAERLALHILKMPPGNADQLARSILEVKGRTRSCSRCHAWSDDAMCPICQDGSRQTGLLCVVEQPADMVAVEKSGAFRGVYHILGGVLSPMNGIGPDDIRVPELFRRVRDEAVREVVIATGTNVEGEATAAYLAEQLQTLSVQVTRIASGVPMGGDLKYVDQVTLKRAMETRHAF